MLKTLNMALKKDTSASRQRQTFPQKVTKIAKNCLKYHMKWIVNKFLIHGHVLLWNFNDFWREMLELLSILCSLSEKEVWDQRSEVRPWSACVTQRVITSSGWGQDAKALCPCAAWYQRKNQDIMEVLGSSLFLNQWDPHNLSLTNKLKFIMHALCYVKAVDDQHLLLSVKMAKLCKISLRIVWQNNGNYLGSQDCQKIT